MLNRTIAFAVLGYCCLVTGYAAGPAQGPSDQWVSPATPPQISAALKRFPTKPGYYELTTNWGPHMQRREGSSQGNRQQVSGCMSDSSLRARWGRELTLSPSFSRCTQNEIVVRETSVAFKLVCPGTGGKPSVARVELAINPNGYKVTSRFVDYAPNEQINNEYELVGTWQRNC